MSGTHMSSRARDLIDDFGLHLLPCFVSESTEGSVQAADRPSLGCSPMLSELSETQNNAYWYARFFPGTHVFR